MKSSIIPSTEFARSDVGGHLEMRCQAASTLFLELNVYLCGSLEEK